MIIDTKEISYHTDLLEADDFKTGFCNNWKTISSGLTLLQNAIRNPIAKFVIGLVISTGQATFEHTCPQST